LSVFLNQSISFADKLQKEFKRLGRYDRGVKQAGFLVLYKTTMPSVLIETGFLTNPNEEKFLGDMEGQLKMASAMFTAFEQYKNELEGVSSKTTNSIPVETNDPFTQEQSTDTNGQLNKVVFKVQIETSETQLPPTASKFKGLTVFEYRQDNLYKYTVGSFEEDFKAANAYKNELRSTGFAHAFVVAFQNGERINLEKAIKLAQK
jgi:N-acetylmuramoyl-L-alanine amidase